MIISKNHKKNRRNKTTYKQVININKFDDNYIKKFQKSSYNNKIGEKKNE